MDNSIKGYKGLKAGDHHIKAYVGLPDQYDFMGATQFCLLAHLGLRNWHTVLDFGCGSLRAGRLLIPYLKKGKYFGIDPNKWLIDDVLEKELGYAFVDAFKPSFDFNSDFRFDVFQRTFDFIVLQSILSHTGSDLLNMCLTNARAAMNDRTILLATVIHPKKIGRNPPSGRKHLGWRYPGCVSYEADYFSDVARSKGYYIQSIPWFHPRQSWWLLTLSRQNLLSGKRINSLKGFAVQN